MSGIFIKCATLLFLLSINVGQSRKRSDKQQLDKQWKAFMKEYKKHYDGEEEQTRRKIWERNMNDIEKHNDDYKNGVYKYTIGINEMSDWTDEECLKRATCVSEPDENEEDEEESNELDHECDEECRKKLPKHVDWREKHVITRVKNQGRCGSCWAFGTVGALEAHHALKTKKLIELSEQELLDCSGRYGNNGCEGGLPANALKYVIAKRGLSTEREYPYKGKRRRCKEDRDRRKVPVRKYIKLKKGDERLLKSVVARHGPVIAGIFAPMDDRKFAHYSHGVFHSREHCRSDTSNHAVLIVGYGEHGGTPYWLIKNSWGKRWGRDGYIKMIRNEKNQCGIASFTVLPILKKRE